LQEAFKWVSGGHEFRVNEDKCIAMGDPVCSFIIQKEPID
jgi:predicted hydrocarbon binding protein